MSDLRIWAPRVTQLEIELVDHDERITMSRSAQGVFTAPAPTTCAYMLRADGDRIVDPWARAVDTVLGPCRWVDHTAFTWTDQTFAAKPLAAAVIYELHIGTYTDEGTFDGAADHLSELAALGITHVELMPVATFSGARGWGYDGAALFAPLAAYGGPDGLKRLVARAHALGLAVLLDVVYNHLGPIGNYLENLGPFFRADRQTPWGSAVNVDGPDNEEVRRFFIDNALSWLRDYHFDGLRIDAVHAIEDQSARPFLEQLHDEVEALSVRLDRSLVVIAESDLNDPRVIRTIENHGLGMDAQWSADFHHALHVLLTGETSGYYADFAFEPMHLLARALQNGFVYAGQYSPYRKRAHGRALGDVSLGKLIGFAQNHDQIGNRTCGERLSQLVSPDQLTLAMTLVLTAPFIPMLFMGEEWGASTPFIFFTDHQDQDIAEATREGRRRDFVASGWKPQDVPDPQAKATFALCKLRRAERGTSPHRELHAYTHALIALRTRAADLSAGSPVHVSVDGLLLCMRRGRYVVYANFGAGPLTLAESGTLELASHAEVKRVREAWVVPGNTAAVFDRGEAFGPCDL